jgi:hypothetical protein
LVFLILGAPAARLPGLSKASLTRALSLTASGQPGASSPLSYRRGRKTTAGLTWAAFPNLPISGSRR